MRAVRLGTSLFLKPFIYKTVCERNRGIVPVSPVFLIGRGYENTAAAVSSQLPAKTTTDESGLLFSQIRYATSVSEVYEIMDKNRDVMSSAHYASCFSALSLQNPEELDMENQNFKFLLTRIMRDPAFMTGRKSILLLEAAHRLGIPSRSIFVHACGQVLRSELGRLTLDEQMRAYMILRKMDGFTPLIEALRLALPVVFQAQCREKVERNSSTACFSAHLFATRFCADDPLLITFTANALSKHKEQLRLDQIIKLASANANSKVNTEPVEMLSKYASEVIAANIENLSDEQVKENLVKCNERSNQELVKALWTRVDLSNSLEDIKCLMHSSRSDYCFSSDTFRVVQDLMLRNPDEVKNASGRLLVVLSRFLAIGESRGIASDPVREIMKSADFEKVKSFSTDQIVTTSRNLALIGVYPESLLKSLFEKILPSTEKLYNLAEELLQLDRLIQRRKDGVPSSLALGLSVKISALEEVRKRANHRKVLSAVLHSALGSEEYVISGVVLPCGSRFDALVAMESGTKFVPIAGDAEDIIANPPKDCKLMSVFFIDASQHTALPANYISLRTTIDRLKELNISSVTINTGHWNSCQESEIHDSILDQLLSAYESEVRKEK